MKDHASVIEERAMTFLLIASETRLLSMRGRIDKLMFLEHQNYLFIEEASRLYREHAYDELALCSAVEKGGIAGASKHFNFIASAVTPGTVFESVYLSWLRDAKLRFLRASERAASEETDPSTLVKIRKEALVRYSQISGGKLGFTMAEGVAIAREKMKTIRRLNGKGFIYTGFRRLDDAILALLPGTCTVLGARPGIGKTSLALKMSLKAADEGPVLFNSLEMPPPALVLKLAGMVHGVNTRRFMATHLLSDSDFQEADALVASVEDIPIIFTSIVNFPDLEPLIAEHKPVLTVYDYLQKPPTPAQYRNNRVEFLDDQAQEAADLAIRSNHPLLVLSQVGRAGDKGAKAAHLKGSGGIEEAADNVILAERESDDPESIDWLKIQLTVAKARYGFDGVVQEVLFNRLNQNFSEWNEAEAERIFRNLNVSTVP